MIVSPINKMEEILNAKLDGWINGWVDATGEYYTTICTNTRSKKKLIEYINWICDNPEKRKIMFDNYFEIYGFVYDTKTDNITKHY